MFTFKLMAVVALFVSVAMFSESAAKACKVAYTYNQISQCYGWEKGDQ